MRKRKFRFHDGENGVALAIRVIPRAKKNEIVKFLSDGTIKIRITAPPVNGKANSALIKYLANVLGVPRSSVEIVAGERGRNKIVSIIGVDVETVENKLTKLIK